MKMPTNKLGNCEVHNHIMKPLVQPGFRVCRLDRALSVEPGSLQLNCPLSSSSPNPELRSSAC